jgi:hypothetical protein
MTGPNGQQRFTLDRGRLAGWASRLALLACGFGVCAAGVQAQVTNGNFSAGDTGFGSGYTYTTSVAPTFTAGNYTIGTNPNSYNAGWISMSDPTDSGLNMMIVNGATNGTSPVWDETISVTPDTTYTFTAWVADIYTGGEPAGAMETVTFDAGSNVLATGFSPSSTPGAWTEFTTTYSTGSDTSETLQIVDTNTAFNGNDFALDDISDVGGPSPTPEPSSLLLFASGLASLAGIRQWRKSTGAAS